MNIYKSGHYKILTALAILLFLFGLYYAPKIPYGVEFRGGTLVVVDATAQPDVAALESALSAYGRAVVKSYETPFGYRVEVELPLPEKLALYEELRPQLEEAVANYSHALALGEDPTPYREKVRAIFSQLGIPFQEVENPDEYKRIFLESYDSERSAFQRSVEEAIRAHVPYTSISFKTITPVLSKKFIEKAVDIFLKSAVLVVAFTFFIFRKILPASAVLIGALFDVVIALGFMGFFGIPLTLATFAAILMVIGYSLDTDILLTTRVVKGREPKEEAIWHSFKTGLTMSSTAIIAFTALLVVATILRISLYYEISSVTLLGLLGDMIATWGINAAILYHFYR